MQDVIIQIRDVVARADMTLSIVMAFAVVLAIVMIVLAAIFISRMYTPRGRLDLLLESRAPEKSVNPWITRAVVILVLVTVAVATTWYAERPESCMTCHQDPTYSEGLAESAHASVTCASCHRSSGVTARADDLVRYSGWLWAHYFEAEQVDPGAGAYVDPRRCLGCHGAVREGVIEVRGVKVRHQDFLDLGTDCLTCHGDAGHASVRGVQGQPVMNSCMSCHNDESASAACDVCHVQDPGIRAVAARGGQMNTVGIRPTDCYGCHAEPACNECHGVTMPHPEGFSFPPPEGVGIRYGQQWAPQAGSGFPPGSHARDGFVNRELCFRCHHAPGRVFEPDDSGCWCHGLFGFMHGGPAWIAEHGLQATGQKTGTLSQCAGCHGVPEAHCGFCHPPEYAARYNPRFGPDNYSATPGWPRLDQSAPDWDW